MAAIDLSSFKTTPEPEPDFGDQDLESPGEVDFWVLWFKAWIGTAMAGGVFGMIAWSELGLIIGPFIAAMVAIPVIVTFAVLTWAFWLWRFSVVIAASAGACTGVLSAASVWAPIFATDFVASLVLAGCIGAAGSGLFSGYYWQQKDRPRGAGTAEIAWHYSLRDLFLRFTVVTVLIAGWTLAIAKYFGRMW